MGSGLANSLRILGLGVHAHVNSTYSLMAVGLPTAKEEALSQQGFTEQVLNEKEKGNVDGPKEMYTDDSWAWRP